jgi:hypothetical protein
MRAFTRVAAVAAAAGLLLAPAAGAASAAPARPAAAPAVQAPAVQVPVRSGTTRITTIAGLPGLLLGNHIAVIATDPGTETLINGTTLFAGTRAAAARRLRLPAYRFAFPVKGGHAGTTSLRGQISHRGGILLADTSHGRTVLIGRFIIDLGHRVLTGIVNGNPHTRFTLFRLDLSRARIHPSGRTVRVSRLGLRLSSAAATALNTALNTTIFTGGTTFGTLSSVLHF